MDFSQFGYVVESDLDPTVYSYKHPANLCDAQCVLVGAYLEAHGFVKNQRTNATISSWRNDVSDLITLTQNKINGHRLLHVKHAKRPSY